MDSVSLLLPGFQEHILQASILNQVSIRQTLVICLTISQNAEATTYMVNCPDIVPEKQCGIPGPGVTAISASNTVQVINVDQHDK